MFDRTTGQRSLVSPLTPHEVSWTPLYKNGETPIDFLSQPAEAADFREQSHWLDSVTRTARCSAKATRSTLRYHTASIPTPRPLSRPRPPFLTPRPPLTTRRWFPPIQHPGHATDGSLWTHPFEILDTGLILMAMPTRCRRQRCRLCSPGIWITCASSTWSIMSRGTVRVTNGCAASRRRTTKTATWRHWNRNHSPKRGTSAKQFLFRLTVWCKFWCSLSGSCGYHIIVTIIYGINCEWSWCSRYHKL